MASSLGLPEIARDHALANLAELQATRARRLFVLSPGDLFAFRQMYDERLGVQPPADVEVLEVIPFLAEQLATGKLRLKQSEDAASYAYVDPTHSVRVEERYESPRQLLAAVLPERARELFWRRERAYPCGDLALQFTQPELADALTRARLADAAEAGAAGVVSDGAGSLAHLERHAAAYDLQVRGVYELLADHLAA
jgi:Fe-S oxidoreductase